MPPGGPPQNPKWPSRLSKSFQGLPKFPKVTPQTPKVSPRSAKVSQRWSQVVPEASPDPPKAIKKGAQDQPGTPLRKWTSPYCENPSIYYVFEVAFCENPSIYYVLITSENRIFLRSDENTAPAMRLEPTKKPVLAREREARLFFKKCSTMFSTALLCFAVLCSTLLYSAPL